MHFTAQTLAAVSSVSTIALVVITAWYVKLTHDLVKQGAEALRQQQTPHVVFEVTGTPTVSSRFSVTTAQYHLTNIGPGAARRIRAEWVPSGEVLYQTAALLAEQDSGRCEWAIPEAELPNAQLSVSEIKGEGMKTGGFLANVLLTYTDCLGREFSFDGNGKQIGRSKR